MRRSMMLALALAVGSAHAEECTKPLALVTSVDMTPVQDNRAVLIPVTLNGKPKQLLVDTGGAMTEMSPEVADELGLPRQTTAFQLFDVSGRMSNQFVHADFGIGGLSSKNMVFMLAPSGQEFGGTPIAGLLAPDILKHYDVDIDFGAGKFNLLSQDHCEGKVIYWKADAVAVVPMKVMASGHILLPVLLNGKEIVALLDTGASNTTLSQQVAEKRSASSRAPPTRRRPERWRARVRRRPPITMCSIRWASRGLPSAMSISTSCRISESRWSMRTQRPKPARISPRAEQDETRGESCCSA